MDMNLGKLQENARDSDGMLPSMGSQRVGHNSVIEKQFSFPLKLAGVS